MKIERSFAIKDMGALKYFWGLEFSYDNNNDIFVSQCKYALYLLSFSKFLECKPISTPLVKTKTRTDKCIDKNDCNVHGTSQE